MFGPGWGRESDSESLTIVLLLLRNKHLKYNCSKQQTSSNIFRTTRCDLHLTVSGKLDVFDSLKRTDSFESFVLDSCYTGCVILFFIHKPIHWTNLLLHGNSTTLIALCF